MIVKVRRPRAEHIRWLICTADGRVQRWVSTETLPRHVRAAVMDLPETYWFATLDEAQRMLLHDRVPQQEW